MIDLRRKTEVALCRNDIKRSAGSAGVLIANCEARRLAGRLFGGSRQCFERHLLGIGYVIKKLLPFRRKQAATAASAASSI